MPSSDDRPELVQAGARASRSCAGLVRRRRPDEPTRDQRAAARAAVRGTVLSAQRWRGPAPVRVDRSLAPRSHPRALVDRDRQRHVVGLRGDRARPTSPALRSRSTISRSLLSTARSLDTARRQDRRDAVRGILAEPLQKGTDDRGPPARRTRGRVAASGARSARQVLLDGDGGRRPLGGGGLGTRPPRRQRSPAGAVERAPLRLRPGSYIAQADAYFPDVGLAWEIDSYKHHFSARGLGRDPAPGAREDRASVSMVAHTRPRRLLTDGTRGHAENSGAPIALAAARPCPDLRVVVGILGPRHTCEPREHPGPRTASGTNAEFARIRSNEQRVRCGRGRPYDPASERGFRRA